MDFFLSNFYFYSFSNHYFLTLLLNMSVAREFGCVIASHLSLWQMATLLSSNKAPWWYILYLETEMLFDAKFCRRPIRCWSGHPTLNGQKNSKSENVKEPCRKFQPFPHKYFFFFLENINAFCYLYLNF